ncbi:MULTISPECIES: PIN domain-containing protein [unclassified Moraxella]|uniref:PIN domain-containing protein n=1 Tax=unclassified Moraxella TaxID=2685852 RepID=UPI003AF68018
MKKAIDTNILVRYLMQDDERQTKIVLKLFEDTILQNTRLFVPAVVILETNWILYNVFNLDRTSIVKLFLELMSLDVLDIEYTTVIHRCLSYAQTNTYDLSDLLIGAIAQANDCDTTLTFDKKASKSDYFTLLT